MVTEDEAEETLRTADEYANPLPDNSFTRTFVIAREQSPDDEEHPETEYEFGKINLTSDVHNILQNNIIDKIVSHISDLDKDEKPTQLEPYDVVNSGRSELIQYLEASEIPSFERFDDLIHKEEFDKTTYEPEGEGPQPRFQAMRIQSDSEPDIIIFQKYSSDQVVGKNWLLKLLIGDGKEYNKVEENVLAIPKKIDALYVDDIIYAFNTRNFEEIFDHLHTYRQKARTVIDEVEELGISIHDYDSFYGSIKNDRSALRKMQQVAEQGLYKNLGQEDVQNIITEFDLQLNVNQQDGDWGIEIPNTQNRWELIRLLNDDHLQSQATENKYRVYGKKPASEE